MEHRFRHILGAIAVTLVPAVLSAQGTTVTGRVTNEVGAPLANANVLLEGMALGALTSDNGQFTINVPGGRATGQDVVIHARLIGYRERVATVRLTSGAKIVQDFVLETTPVQLTGVIVTAEGQVKQKSQLGTAAQQVGSDELNKAHGENFLGQLSGKVSGVTITSPGTQGGSTNIIIRGSNSIRGDNSPLFVIDGVPVTNRDRGGDPNGGWDYGSTITDLSADDIASVTVLKGPNAAALYGARAANGAVVIVTKHGANTDGKIETRLISSYSFDKVGILPTYQNQYGQGAGGDFSYYDGTGNGVNDWADQSWGPKLDGRLIDQFTGPQQPWVPHPDNVRSFFNTGHTFDVNLAVSGGTDRANARMSVGVQNVDGIVPNNFLHRWSSALGGGLRVGDRFSTTANLQFLRNNGLNRPGTGYNAGILEQFIWFGRQVDMNALRAHWMDYNQFGDHYNWNTNYHSNPFWLQYANPQADSRDQWIGSVSSVYQVTDWLNATLRFGGNIARFTNQQDIAAGNVSWAGYGITDLNYAGAFNLFNNNSTEYTTTFLLNANKNITSKLDVTGLLAFGKNTQQYNSVSQSTTGLSVPGIYNVSNAAVAPTLGQYDERQETNSIFGSASFTWDGWWTVEGTARNDWSSTLPKANNSYFYPSVNTSIVLTDAIPSLKSNVLSFLKLRGSIAKVGNAASPYSLLTTYAGNSNKFAGLPQYSLGDVLANADLKPEETKASEVGFELGLFGDRASLDATYYSKATSNQVINITVSPASGFSQKAINAGKITNKGFEALLNVTPVRTQSGFEWNTTFSFSKNSSKVATLYPGINTIVLGSSWYLNVEARQGDPYGALYGYRFARDSATGELLLHNGLPQLGDQVVLGNVQPDWVGGWSNEFRYKNVSLSVLLDIHQGGDIFSVSNFFGEYAGVFASTMNGRQKDWNDPGLVIKGIDDATGQANTTNVTSEQYYQSIFPVQEPYIYKDSYVKLRELRVGFDLPRSMTDMMHATSVNIAFYGRNLWTHTNVPNIDPEFTYTTGNFQGVEFAALPNPKTFGINLTVTP